MSETPRPLSDGTLRAMHPTIVYGRDLLHQESQRWGSYIVITMPEPWQAARPLLATEPAAVVYVESTDHAAVEATAADLPEGDTVVGLGGGMALDVAKFSAWERGENPILVPSIASVDACVTNSVAVREDGRVRYIGFGVAERIIVDFGLVGGAPKRLNRAGIGDILSIHTACWDWQVAAARGEADYDVGIAAQATDLVAGLEENSDAIRQVTDDGIRWLFEAYAKENSLCLRIGHSRPEEGSEHYVAYCVEHRTGKQFVHGELVSLGVLLMSRLQQNAPDRVQEILSRCGVRYQPLDLGLSRGEIIDALQALPGYVAEEELPYSVIQQRSEKLAEPGELLEGLEFA